MGVAPSCPSRGAGARVGTTWPRVNLVPPFAAGTQGSVSLGPSWSEVWCICSRFAISLEPSLVWRVSVLAVRWQTVCGTAVAC